MIKTCQLPQQGIVESQKIIGFDCNQNYNKFVDPLLSGNTLFQITDEDWNQHERMMIVMKLLNQNEQKSRDLTICISVVKRVMNKLMKDEEDNSRYLR